MLRRAGAYLRAVAERETARVRGATSGTRRHTLLASARVLVHNLDERHDKPRPRTGKVW